MVNRIVLMGRLTKDPELRVTTTGVSVTTFTIAVDRDFKNKAGERDTDFIACSAWRTMAEFVTQHFTKGRMICVDGRLQMERWSGSEGHNRTSPNVQVEHVYFCGDREAPASEPKYEELDENDPDHPLPF